MSLMGLDKFATNLCGPLKVRAMAEDMIIVVVYSGMADMISRVKSASPLRIIGVQ